MACVTLTKSKRLPCISTLTGIKAIGIGVYDGSNLIEKTETGVVNLATAYPIASIARLELKNSTTKVLETGTLSPEARSYGIKGELTAVFNVPPGGDIDSSELVNELLKGEVVIFAERKDGVIMACGSQYGVNTVTAISDTGGTTGDLNGFTVTFNWEETDFARSYILTGTALVDYAAALMPYV